MSHKDKPQSIENRPPIEGEGSRSADAEYRRRTEAFVKSGKVEKGAEEAKRAVEGEEHDELEQAEKDARKHAKEEDPQVVLDRRRKGAPPDET